MSHRIFTAVGPRYAEVKDHLFDQYVFPAYDDRTGLSSEDLKAGFDAILEEFADEPRLKLKARLFRFVMENARIDVDPVGWFADHFDHNHEKGILYDLHERWRREEGEQVIPDAEDVLSMGNRTGSFFGGLDLGHIIELSADCQKT